jgi:hypothetical protein
LETVHTVGVISKMIVVHEGNPEFALVKWFVMFEFEVFKFEIERVKRMIKLHIKRSHHLTADEL